MSIDDKQIAQFKEKLIRHFADVPPPDNQRIALGNDWESQALQDAFSDVDWRTADKQIIQRNYDQLPFFSPEAFHFFIPAFLVYSVDEPEGSRVFEYTVYALTPGKETDNTSQWYVDRLRLFTREQMSSIYEFLDLVRQNPKAYDFYVRIDRGKKRLERYFELAHFTEA